MIKATKFVFIEAASGNSVNEKWIINPTEEERNIFITENQTEVDLMNANRHITRRSMVIDYTDANIKDANISEFSKMPLGMFIELTKSL